MTSSHAEHPKDVHRVAAGYKATIHNPNVSLEAKEQAKEKLREMGESIDSPSPRTHEAAHSKQGGSEVEESTHVLGGYKATLSSKPAHLEAKRHAEEVLQAAGILERHPDHNDEQHQVRVLAGCKAALHNPRVSEEGKKRAREYLEAHGVEL